MLSADVMNTQSQTCNEVLHCTGVFKLGHNSDSKSPVNPLVIKHRKEHASLDVCK